MLSKRYESTEVDRRTWLHVPSGTRWSTSSDTNQVDEIKKETSTKMNSVQNTKEKCKIQKNWCTVTVAPTIEHHGGYSRTPANQMWDRKQSISSNTWENDEKDI